MALLFYGALLLAAALWSLATDSCLLYANPRAEQRGLAPGRDAVVGLAAGALAIVASREFTRRTAAGERVARRLGSLLGPLTLRECLVLAVASGVAEEAFFRGALQPRVGLVAASLIFGAAHFVPRRELLPWTVTTVLAGFLLGFLFERTGNLVAPVVTHGLVNAVNLRWLALHYGAPGAR